MRSTAYERAGVVIVNVERAVIVECAVFERHGLLHVSRLTTPKSPSMSIIVVRLVCQIFGRWLPLGELPPGRIQLFASTDDNRITFELTVAHSTTTRHQVHIVILALRRLGLDNRVDKSARRALVDRGHKALMP